MSPFPSAPRRTITSRGPRPLNTRRHRLRLTQPVAKRRSPAAILGTYLVKPFKSSGWSKLLPLATAVAAIGGLVFSGSNLQQTRHQADLSEQSQNSDRFRESVKQIADDKIEVQLGGIYSLDRLAREAPKPYHGVVFEVMGAYVRAKAAKRGCPPESSKCSADCACPPQDRLPTTIQAALTVISDRETPEDDEIDLNTTCLREAMLAGSAHLSHAKLYGADLRHADLQGADLSGKANLRGADLRYTFLDHTNFSGADLMGADFSEAVFGRTNLSGADLSGAADLRGTDLTYTDLSNIYYDRSTVWPEHFVPPPSRPKK